MGICALVCKLYLHDYNKDTQCATACLEVLKISVCACNLQGLNKIVITFTLDMVVLYITKFWYTVRHKSKYMTSHLNQTSQWFPFKCVLLVPFCIYNVKPIFKNVNIMESCLCKCGSIKIKVVEHQCGLTLKQVESYPCRVQSLHPVTMISYVQPIKVPHLNHACLFLPF